MGKQIPETDQWLLGGDCDKCRKDAYCDKECGPYKRYKKEQMAKAYKKLMQRAKEKWDEEHKDNNNTDNGNDTADGV